MSQDQVVYISMFAVGCVTLMIVVATLMGHNGGLVAGAVGTVTSAVGALLGIDQGGKKKEKAIRKDLDILDKLMWEEKREKSQGSTPGG